MSIHRVVENGFQASSRYDKHRPSYPEEAVQRLMELAEIEDGSTVLDLGAGTGKFTEMLSKEAESKSFRIIAVEPHSKMRSELERKQLPNVVIEDGTAEKMDGIATGSIDLVVASQSFHWFASMAALKEIHRVLKPAKQLILIWNIEDYNAPKEWKTHDGWEQTMKHVMWSLDDGQDRFRNGKWKSIFDEQGASNPVSIFSSDPLFGLPIGEEIFEFQRWLDRDHIWNAFQTYSAVANLDATHLAEIEKTFTEATNSPDVEVDDQGRIAVHGKTLIAYTSSIPSEPINS